MSTPADRPAEIKARTRGRWTRVYVESDERDVSHLSYAPHLLAVGPQGATRMAGIGGVATDAEFRRRGLARAVFERAMHDIRAEGYASVGLYTSERIVAHRLYRRLGFVDVVRRKHARKLLDPGRFVCDCLSALTGEEAAVRGTRPRLRVELGSHEPVWVRLEASGTELLDCEPRAVELALTMSCGTLLGLRNWEFDLHYAEAAKLVTWRGESEVFQLLAEAVAAGQQPINEG